MDQSQVIHKTMIYQCMNYWTFQSTHLFTSTQVWKVHSSRKNAKSYELWILTCFKENNQNCYFIVALRYDVQPFCQISWTNVKNWPITDFYFHHCTCDIKDLLSILTLTHNRCHCTGTLLSFLHEGVASRVVQYRSTS